MRQGKDERFGVGCGTGDVSKDAMTTPLQRLRRKRGPGTDLPTNEEAMAWAKKQPWWPRVVEMGNSRDWWIWKTSKP